ncbi:MAG: ABC transporter substrate-binding protein [Mesorhizobium sp.]
MSSLVYRLTAPNGPVDQAWPPIVVFLVIVAAWEGAIRAFDIPVYVLPAPGDIYLAFVKNPGPLLWNAGVTLFEAVAGFVIGSLLGAVLGTIFAYSKVLARGVLPYIIAANTIPVVAIAPIIIIWFGHGMSSKKLGAGAVKTFSAKDTGCSVLKDGLVVSTRFAEADRQVVQAVVDAILEGWTIAFQEPERAIAVCLEARPDMSEAEHRRQLADIRALALTGATLTEGLGYPDPTHVEQAARAIAEVEGHVVDTSSILDLSFWQAAPEGFRARIQE